MKKKIFPHIQTHIFRGLFAIIPILLCVLAIQLLYLLIDKRVMSFLNKFIEVRKIPGLGILLLLISLYLIGLIVSNIIGRRFLKLVETLSSKIPFIKSIYEVGKEISQGLSFVGEKKHAFQKSVLVKLNADGLWIPGFIMSSLISQTTKEELFFVLIPTAPTPASGFVCVVRAAQIFDPGWSIEEMLKAIVSVGIVTPKEKEINL